MNILSPGFPESAKVFIASCPRCKCQFTYKKNELNKRDTDYCDPRDAMYDSINCPQSGCGYSMTIASHKEYIISPD
jgi:hypothetical protein